MSNLAFCASLKDLKLISEFKKIAERVRDKMRIKPYVFFVQTISPVIAVLLRFRACIEPSTRTTNGMVSITFDDGMKSQFDYAFPLMKARRIKGTFYVTTDDIRDFSHDPSFMSMSELQNLEANGNEIGSHSKTHSYLTSLSDERIHDECKFSKELLQSNGFTAENFAYPYGDTNERVNAIVSQYYSTGRSAYKKPYLMHPSSSQFELTGFAGETGDSSALLRLQHIINLVALTNSYAIVFFHDVNPNRRPDRITISLQDFSSFLAYSVSKGVQFLTVKQALDRARAIPNNMRIKSNLFLM
jgi:peptidoglycan/xylan/chitin deacetylase (PgdA/CDA1 family)